MRAWYELKFQVEFCRKSGNAFQDFFTSIMERGYPADFHKVKPYGNVGDKKCDGYHRSLKRVYQVYAPERMSSSQTITKIEEDFCGAVEHWGERMMTWVFVHNQYRGVPPDVLLTLLALDGRDGVRVLLWGEQEIQTELFRLSPEDQAALLGAAPTQHTFTNMGMKEVIEVANAIAQLEVPPPEQIRQVSAGKLKANALTEYVQTLLRIGSQKSKLVQRFFFDWHEPELGDRIAKAFRQKYEDLRANGTVGDQIFHELWRFAGGGSQPSARHEAAVLAVVALLFEQCDIFEPSRS